MRKFYTIGFFVGLAIMGIELSASRLIAPYFGTSLFVWTNVIAVIMAALSVGYYLGGRISEQFPSLRILLRIILIAGILLAGIPFLARPVASLVSVSELNFFSASFIILIGSFFLTVALFFLPIMLLGMVSPFLIKLASWQRSDVGNIAGRMFALGTVGSIVGTFLPALIFIPWIGTKFTILVFASLLIVIGLLGFASKRLFIILPLLGLPFGFFNFTIRPVPGLVVEKESPYQYLQVVKQGDANLLVYNEGGGVQSVYRPGTVFNNGNYWVAAALLPAIREGKNILIIGLAGGTVSRSMQALYGSDASFKMSGVEIDPAVIDLAKKYFALAQPNLRVINMDGRLALNFGADLYDVIFVDAYTNQLYIPFHLTTKEFFESAADRLSKKGMVAINVNAASDDSELLQSITNTMASVWPHVYRVPVVNSWNYLIIGSPETIDFSTLNTATISDPEFKQYAAIIADSVFEINFDPKKTVLTDDKAPIEQMTDDMFWQELVKQLHSSAS